jgi:hypothetical protein
VGTLQEAVLGDLRMHDRLPWVAPSVDVYLVAPVDESGDLVQDPGLRQLREPADDERDLQRRAFFAVVTGGAT